jgi:hypothetical protein
LWFDNEQFKTALQNQVGIVLLGLLCVDNISIRPAFLCC